MSEINIPRNQPKKNRGGLRSPLKRLLFLAVLLLLVPVTEKEIEGRAAELEPLVIGVAEWRNEGGPDMDVQDNAYVALLAQINEFDMENVELVKIPAKMNNAMETDQVAVEFGVDMILWGWYDEVATRSYVDLANATQEDGLTNSLDAFLRHGGSTQAIRVLKILSSFDYYETGLYFCVPRWTP